MQYVIKKSDTAIENIEVLHFYDKKFFLWTILLY